MDKNASSNSHSHIFFYTLDSFCLTMCMLLIINTITTVTFICKLTPLKLYTHLVRRNLQFSDIFHAGRSQAITKITAVTSNVQKAIKTP